MNLGVLLGTFALVIPAELPDKTFITCVVMSSRHRALPVWVGGAAGLTLQAAIAVVAGHFLSLLPQTALRAVVATLFIGGAAYLLFVPEKAETKKAERLGGADEEEVLGAGRAARGGADGGDEAPPADVTPADVTPADLTPVDLTMLRSWRPALTTFGIVALAEFGDVTQVLIANLSARYKAGLAVFIGATAGFLLVSAAGVLGGKAIVRVVPLSLVRRLSGLAMLGLGLFTIVELL